MKESKAMMKKEVAFMKKKGAPKSMLKHEKAEMKGMKKGGMCKGYADGGVLNKATHMQKSKLTGPERRVARAQQRVAPGSTFDSPKEKARMEARAARLKENLPRKMENRKDRLLERKPNQQTGGSQIKSAISGLGAVAKTGMKKGGSVSARADGCCVRGKTRGRMV